MTHAADILRDRRRGLPGSFVGRIALVASAALALRLLYILVIARAPVGVGGDAGFYHSAANLIAQGRFYDRGIFGQAYVTAEHPPLYPLLLSVVSLAGGDTLLAHRIVGCVVGAGAVGLIGLLGREVMGERAGLLAASIAAVYPPLVTADGLVMSEPLFVLAVVVALLLAGRLIAAPTFARAAVLGAVVGLATLTRGEGLALLPLLAWPAAFAPARGRALRVTAASVATLAVLAPWVIRNAVVLHRLTLATDASTLIAGANCRDTYYGHDIGWWSPGCLARSRTRAQLDAGDASIAAGVRYAGAHLTRLPLVGVVRALRTFDLFQPLRQGNHERRRRWVDIAGLAFYYPLLGLASFGLVRLRGARPRGARPPTASSRPSALLLAPVWMVLIVSVLGWGIGRFRVGADASLIVLAAVALTPRPASLNPAPSTRSRPLRVRASGG
ncbi:MAG: ArnT family glycosyltransferase [Solirubrobacteraceae bacterium]